MLAHLFNARPVTSPAIWGRLPAHADFVRHGVRHGEAEGWEAWLRGALGRAASQHEPDAGRALRTSIPIAFVLPPGHVPFAQGRFVLGVILPSTDRVGRRHPLVVYQVARRVWIERHYERHVHEPRSWQFGLARLLAQHVQARADCELRQLAQHVDRLWCELGDGGCGGPAGKAADAPAVRAPAHGFHDPAAALHGVRHLPWSDWPRRLQGVRGHCAFWQQDVAGRFVNASENLVSLWEGRHGRHG